MNRTFINLEVQTLLKKQYSDYWGQKALLLKQVPWVRERVSP